jgi:phage antirepressor YoqD-like protein
VQCTVSKEYEAMSTRTSNIFRDNVSTTPLSVTIKVACKLVGIGNTTMWKLPRWFTQLTAERVSCALS